MQLTKGQKDALVRKARQIVDAKREEAQQRYIKEYKPTAKAAALLDKLKDVDKARDAYRKAVKAAGLEFTRYSIILSVPNSSSIAADHDIEMSFHDYFSKAIMKRALNKKAEEDGIRFFTYDDIADDIELACLDKSFDMDAFLAKYNNL